jgi:drug/metabolite transporter (DMT)-like permease
MIITYGLLLLNIILLLAGQTLWKLGIEQMGGFHLHNAIPVMTSPLIVSGCVLYGIATALWLAVLSRLPLSIAYPMQSLAYVFGLLLAWLIFGEAVPPNRWIGAGIILAGVFVVAVK